MKPSKPKAAEPSLRDKLSKNFLEALEADFREIWQGRYRADAHKGSNTLR
jgi:hypothetical protein